MKLTSADGTLATDTGGVLTGATVNNGINGNLDGVLVGHNVDLLPIISI